MWTLGHLGFIRCTGEFLMSNWHSALEAILLFGSVGLSIWYWRGTKGAAGVDATERSLAAQSITAQLNGALTAGTIVTAVCGFMLARPTPPSAAALGHLHMAIFYSFLSILCALWTLANLGPVSAKKNPLNAPQISIPSFIAMVLLAAGAGRITHALLVV